MNILEIIATAILVFWWYLEIRYLKDDSVGGVILYTMCFIFYVVYRFWDSLTTPLW